MPGQEMQSKHPMPHLPGPSQPSVAPSPLLLAPGPRRRKRQRSRPSVRPAREVWGRTRTWARTHTHTHMLPCRSLCSLMVPLLLRPERPVICSKQPLPEPSPLSPVLRTVLLPCAQRLGTCLYMSANISSRTDTKKSCFMVGETASGALLPLSTVCLKRTKSLPLPGPQLQVGIAEDQILLQTLQDSVHEPRPLAA